MLRLLQPRPALIAFTVGYTAWRLAMIGSFPLSPDEAYYFSWSRVPAIAYYDQPGMVAWVDWLFNLPWDRPTAFTVRLGAVVSGALCILLAFWAYLQYRRDEREAAAFAAVFSLLPFSWLAGIMMIHDTTLLPWLLAAFGFALRLARDDGRTRDWLGFSLTLTAAMYAKLSAVMLSWGIILYMLWTPRGRKWFSRWQPWAMGLMIAVLYLPVVWWNLEHDLINLKAVSELTDVGDRSFSESLTSLFEYLISQPLMFSPALGLIAFSALLLGAFRVFRRPGDPDAMPVCLALPVFVYFAQLAFRAKVFGNWPGVAYFPVALLAAGEVFRRRESGDWTGLFGRRVFLVGLALNLLLLTAAGLHLSRRVFRPWFGMIEERFQLKKHLDWRLDLDFGGWEEAVAVVEAERGNAIIVARRYQVASMLEFLLPDRPRVYSWNRGQRGNQWDLWPGPPPAAGRNAIYIDIKKMPRGFAALCDQVEPIHVPLLVGDPRRPVKDWWVYRCRGFNGTLPAPPDR